MKARRTTAALTLRDQCDLPAAGRWAFRSPGASASASPVRRHTLGPRLAPRKRAPRCAMLRRGAPHPRLDVELAAPRRQPAHHAAPWRSPSAGMRAGRTTARPGMTGLTCCTGGKSHRPNRARRQHQCKCQRLEEDNVLPGHALQSVLAGGFSRSYRQLHPPPMADTGCLTGTLCCRAAVFAAVPGP